jgi:hypothetical protein
VRILFLDIKNTFNECELEDIYKKAVLRYIDSRKSKVAAFVKENYDFKASIKLHQHSMGWDIVKTPVNAISSIVTVIKQTSSFCLGKLGAGSLSEII